MAPMSFQPLDDQRRSPQPTAACTSSLSRDLLQALALRVSAEPRIRLAALFGSAAKGKLRPDSDVDVYVVLEAGAAWTLGWLSSLSSELEGIVGRPVDVVVEDRDRTSALLRMEVARDGVLLVQRQPWDWTTVRANALIDYADLAPAIDACAAGVRERFKRQREQLDGR